MTIALALGYVFAIASGFCAGVVYSSRTRAAKVDAGILRAVRADAELAEAEARLVDRIAREELIDAIDQKLC